MRVDVNPCCVASPSSAADRLAETSRGRRGPCSPQAAATWTCVQAFVVPCQESSLLRRDGRHGPLPQAHLSSRHGQCLTRCGLRGRCPGGGGRGGTQPQGQEVTVSQAPGRRGPRPITGRHRVGLRRVELAANRAIRSWCCTAITERANTGDARRSQPRRRRAGEDRGHFIASPGRRPVARVLGPVLGSKRPFSS